MNGNYRHTISCMGDSLTDNYSLGVSPNLLYPGQLQALLRASGCKVSVRNFGASGDTTAPVSGKPGMTVRLPVTWQFSVPDIAILWGGTNDAGNSINQAATQANLQSMVTSLQSAGVQRFVIVGNHFANYSAGGDFDVSNNPQPDTAAGAASVIAAQKAAVAFFVSPNVVYADTYAYMVGLLTTNPTWKKDWTQWHPADSNYHFNARGCGHIAQCIYNVIQTAGWLDALKV